MLSGISVHALRTSVGQDEQVAPYGKRRRAVAMERRTVKVSHQLIELLRGGR